MTSLKGNLNSVDLANIFQMLSLNQREGTLYIFEGASRKAIYFGHDGVSMLSKGRTKSDTLGRILLRYDRVTSEQLTAALDKKADGGRLIGQVLVEEGLCSRNDIDEALQIQIQEEVYSLFIWKDAQFEFIEGEPDEEFRSEGVQKLTFNVNSLIMEAAKRVDEWEWIQGVVPDSQEVYRYTGRNVDLTESIFQEPYAGKVLAAIDGRRSADEVIDASYVNRFEVCKILAVLLEGGAIEKLPVVDLRREAEAAVAAGDTDAAVKFLSRLVVVKGDTPQMHKQLAEAFEGDRELEKAAFHYRVYAEIQADHHEVKDAFNVYRRICEFLPTDLAAADRMIEVFAINPDGLEEHAKEIIERGKQLAEIYVELHRSSRAIQILHRVVSLGPDDADLRNRLISVYLASGMPGEAIAEYEALADTATAVKDFENAEKIYRKILTIDRHRTEVIARLDQLVSKKKRRAKNVRNLVVGGVAIAVCAVGAWYGLSWYQGQKAAEAQREIQSYERLQAIRVTAAPVRAELDALLKELANRPVDVLLLAKAQREHQARVGDADKRATEIVRSLTELRAEFQGLPADEDAVGFANELSGKLVTLKKKVAEIQKSLRESADGSVDDAQRMIQDGEPTRTVLATLELAMKIGEDCDNWLTTDKGQSCVDRLADVKHYIAKFEVARAEVQKKLDDNDVDGAYRLAIGYITANDFPPPDLRSEMPVPVRLATRPPGAHVMTKDGVDTGLVTGPSCVVTISVVTGAGFELELPGFNKGSITIPPVREVDAATVELKVRKSYEVMLEKTQAFNKRTVDNRPLTAAPFGSNRTIVMPSSRSCDVVDLAKRQVVTTLPVGSERGVRASGVIVAADDGTEIVVIPVADGSLAFYDAATGKSRGSWQEARGILGFDLALSGTDVLAADDRGNLYCVNATTRQKRWGYQALSATGEPASFSSAPTVANGAVYVGCDNGSVHVVDLSKGQLTGKLLAPSAEAGRVSAQVTVADGFAWFVNRDASKQSRLTKWNLATGRAEWSIVLAGDMKSAPMLHEGTVFVVTTSGDVYGLKVLDGAQTHVATVERGVKVLGEATIDGDALLVPCDNGVLYALDVRGREIEPLWKFAIKASSGRAVPITTRCASVGGLIVFAAADNSIYALEGGK